LTLADASPLWQHGVKRSRLSAEDAIRKRNDEASKIQEFQALKADCLERKQRCEYSSEAFELTNKLLDFNPEFYTIWNYRRLILLHGFFPSITPEDRYSYLTSDLRLTTAYLKSHPKVYWIWTHRQWCLENIPDAEASSPVDGVEVNRDKDEWRNQAWRKELYTVEKMLEVDARNFHAWNYRRYVLASLPSTFKPAKTPMTELKYTTKKIESNFSNFSAWHQRTKILGKLWEEMEGEERGNERRKMKEAGMSSLASLSGIPLIAASLRI